MATNRIHEANGHDLPASHGHVTDAFPGAEDIGRQEIEAQLESILASSSFRNSKRHTHFLRFVVGKSLSGGGAEIKERLIGIEVFDRPADYDLTTDPIVRGAAAELRKRLAQYYADPKHAGELRFELPLGTYAPTFHRSQAQSPIEAPPTAPELPELRVPAADREFPLPTNLHDPAQPHGQNKRPLRRIVFGLSALLLVLVVAGSYVFYSRRASFDQRELNRFWAPLMNGGDTIMVCAGDLNHFLKEPPVENDTWLHFTATRNHLDPNVGSALLHIGRILGARGKRGILRLADMTELLDLRQQPVIFVGGFNNPWTQRILSGLRFQMLSSPDSSYAMISDRENPKMTAWRIDFASPVNSIDRDYSLVTRMDDPLTGEPVVLLSGLGSYGNSAASEFVSNPAYFSQFSRTAPKGWESRTVQIVLETTVVDGRVSVPRVIAEQVY